MADSNNTASTFLRMSGEAWDELRDNPGVQSNLKLEYDLKYALASLFLAQVNLSLGDHEQVHTLCDEILDIYDEVLETLNTEGAEGKTEHHTLRQVALWEKAIACRVKGDAKFIKYEGLTQKNGQNSRALQEDLGGILMEVEDTYEECSRIFNELEDPWGIGMAKSALGSLAFVQGDYNKAKDLQETSAELMKNEGDRWGQAVTELRLGSLNMGMNDLEKASDHLLEALDLWANIGSGRGIAKAIAGLCAVFIKKRRDINTTKTVIKLCEAIKEYFPKDATNLNYLIYSAYDIEFHHILDEAKQRLKDPIEQQEAMNEGKKLGLLDAADEVKIYQNSLYAGDRYDRLKT